MAWKPACLPPLRRSGQDCREGRAGCCSGAGCGGRVTGTATCPSSGPFPSPPHRPSPTASGSIPAPPHSPLPGAHESTFSPSFFLLSACPPSAILPPDSCPHSSLPPPRVPEAPLSQPHWAPPDSSSSKHCLQPKNPSQGSRGCALDPRLQREGDSWNDLPKALTHPRVTISLVWLDAEHLINV